MNCQKCGCQVSSNDTFCPECGSKIEVQYNASQGYQRQFCPDCGTEVLENDMFCPGCGRNIKAAEPVINTYTQPVKPKGNGSAAAVIIAIVAVLLLVVGVVLIAFRFIKPNETETAEVTQTPSQTESVTEAPSIPVFTSITASSTRGYDKDNSTGEIVYYYPSYISDGDFTTAWSSNRNIELTPTITFSSNEKQRVSGIRMTNGYCKSVKTYTKNRRITRVHIKYEGGEVTQSFGLENYRNMIDIPFGKTVDTNYVSIQVLDSQYGEWKDIAISEVEFY